MDNYFEQFQRNNTSKPLEWRDVYNKLLPKWNWFVISSIIAIVLGVIYSRTLSDQFMVKSSMLIIDSKNGQMSEMSVIRQLDASAGSKSSYSTVGNEVQVLKSTAIMKRVVGQLGLNVQYLKEGVLRDEELYTRSPFSVYMDSVSLNTMQGDIRLLISKTGKSYQVEYQCQGKSNCCLIKEIPAVVSTPYGNVYILNRKKVNSSNDIVPLTSDLRLKIDISSVTSAARKYADAITASVEKMQDVVELSIATNNIQKGQDILNTLASIYNQDASEQNNLSANNTAKFIDERLGILSDELSDVEKNVEDYKQNNNLTDIDDDAKEFLTKRSSFYQQQVQVEMQQHLVRFVDDFIHSSSNQYSPIPNLGLSDPAINAVIQKYNELLLIRDRMTRTMSEDNPSIKSVNSEIENSRKAIKNAILLARKGLMITNNDLEKQNNSIQSKIRNVPRQEREMLEIKRQQQVKAQLYLFLLQKREEASLNMAVRVPKGRVLNAPDYATYMGPRRSVIVVIFLLIGILVPCVIIYFSELFNTKIRSREDVEKRTQVPVISELGHNDSSEMIVDPTPNSSTNAELFRLLRTKLQFILNGPESKVILVTSTIPGEGKTFVSINLSLMLTLAEKKVLLIGLDLRNPQLEKHFGYGKVVGVSSYLASQVENYKELLFQFEGFPMLEVLPAGIIPPNPSELLYNKRLDTLIESVKAEYDYIVLDTAPIGAVSDSLIIDRISDISLYVCRSSYTDLVSIDYINRVYREKMLKNMYLIVNDVDFVSSKYRKHGYGYGYTSAAVLSDVKKPFLHKIFKFR